MSTMTDNIVQVPPGSLQSNSIFFAPLLFILGRDAFREGFLSTGHTSRELDLEDVTNLITGSQKSIQVVLVVSGRDTESRARADEGSGGVTDNNDRDLTSEHFVAESRELGGVVQHDGDNRRVIMAIDDESESLKSEAEVSRVECNTLESLLALTRAKFAGNKLQ